jgi:hypothetical protein
MRVMSAAVILSMMLLVSIPCLSEAQHSFDLDVPEGHYSYWKIDDLGLATAAEVDFEVKELRRHERWTPSFQFALEGGTKRTALIFFGTPSDGSITVGLQSWDGDTQTADLRIPGWRVAPRERVKLRLDWTTRGALSVTGSGVSYGPFRVDFTPKALTVVASTGQMVGHSLNLKVAFLESIPPEPSERVNTANGLRRRLSSKDAKATRYAIWSAFVALMVERYEDLTPAQRPAHLIFQYDSEVQNGGHYQYFENRSADRGAETIAALKMLALHCQADVLATALRKWAERDRGAPDSAAEFVENAQEGEFDELDYTYHECRPTTSDGLKAHLQKHRQEFVLVEPE